MCVCMYVYLCVFACVYMCVCVWVRVSVCLCAYMRGYIYACMLVLCNQWECAIMHINLLKLVDYGWTSPKGNRHIKATKEYNAKCDYTFIDTELGCIYITRYVLYY